MINSKIISETPLVIKHSLSLSISEYESQKGVDDAIKLIEDIAPKGKKFRMLIDVSDYSFETLEARRIWSLQFKMNQSIQQKADFVAIVGSPHEDNNSEKAWMETTILKFFENERDAELWLIEAK